MLKISTFNIKNDYKNYNINKTKDIYNYLIKNKIDILNLQELYKPLEKDLVKYLNKNNYNLYGSYRFKLPVLRKVNEKVPVITNKQVLKSNTYYLPHLPSLMKRVMTKTIIEDKKYKKIIIINLHLEVKYDNVKKKQLDYILKVIKKENLPMIITGDFNLKNNKEIFNNFVDELKKLNINHIEIKEKTLKQSKYKRAIDHIFYSNNFKLKEYKVVKDLNISDHYPVEAIFE